MGQFKVTFKHFVEEEYDAIIEADSEEEAEAKVLADPFTYADDTPIEHNGISIDILSIEEQL